MKLNTLIRLPDGRIGTICYNGLDGRGGIWGRHNFVMEGNGENLPKPEFMLREPIAHWKNYEDRKNVECVGENFEVIN